MSLALNSLDLHSSASESRRTFGICVGSANKQDPGEQDVPGELGGMAPGESRGGAGGSEGNPGCCAGVQAQGSESGTQGLQGTRNTGGASEAVPASKSLHASQVRPEDASCSTGWARDRPSAHGSAHQTAHQTAPAEWDQVRMFVLGLLDVGIRHCEECACTLSAADGCEHAHACTRSYIRRKHWRAWTQSFPAFCSPAPNLMIAWKKVLYPLALFCGITCTCNFVQDPKPLHPHP